MKPAAFLAAALSGSVLVCILAVFGIYARSDMGLLFAVGTALCAYIVQCLEAINQIAFDGTAPNKTAYYFWAASACLGFASFAASALTLAE